MIRIDISKLLTEPGRTISIELNISFETGKFVSIFGPSGSGKSTILKMLAGLITPDRGVVEVNQEKWFDSEQQINLKPQKRDIAMVFQEPAHFPNMTVLENLRYALRSSSDIHLVEEILGIMELEALRNSKPNSLSGGQKQRLALARALVRKPKLLLLDEPLSAIDHKMRSRLQDYLLEVHSKSQCSTLLVSHELSEIYKMSQLVFKLEDGKIVGIGDPRKIFTDSKISGKFQFTGEVLSIDKEDIVYVVTVLIGNSIVKVIALEEEIQDLSIGDKVLASSKAFNPLLKKI
ncbi:molybdenum ABC transporter ATP-binding protein [Leptospira perolatii]|uniref:Molybdenum ABC transporter ATP-binding protein n=1 Tax=Leptospira perolatii TaxID=2023191 RepID=A0A2M9ZLZ5_9LEPT|nr:ATP-binding cassette domain-containing protein [Leptospira perolatii]PJZ69738.1 molybdenum ABC transporter ATP-binding protein [Leptospira perolatii]PJZ73047.1 molybdenum ABC transporter ATP-binding protein [Leptospira perolatii]